MIGTLAAIGTMNTTLSPLDLGNSTRTPAGGRIKTSSTFSVSSARTVTSWVAISGASRPFS